MLNLGDVTISSSAPSEILHSRQAIEEGAELFGRAAAAWLKLTGRISLGLKLEETWSVRYYFRGQIVVLGEELFVGEILVGHISPDGGFSSAHCHKVIFDPKEFWTIDYYIKLAAILADNLKKVQGILIELGAGSLKIV